MHRGTRWEGSRRPLRPSPAPLPGLGAPQVILTHNSSASYLGPKAGNGICRLFSNVKERHGESISVCDERLWPHSYLKFLGDKIFQNTESIKEIIKGIFGVKRVGCGPTPICIARLSERAARAAQWPLD